MRKSKFFAVLFILSLSFLAVFGYGCGGGGGGGSGGNSNNPENPDNPENNEEIQYSASHDVGYALSHVIIGYQGGDYADYVTQNVSLPSESEGLAITWSSNTPSVISNSGSVSRPSGNNANVTLTAGATSGDYSGTVDFVLNVIQARTRTIEEAKSHEPVTPADIEGMNESNDNFMMTYDNSEELVRHIDGKFTDVEVHNADDALDAVQSVHEILGIDDPYEELEVQNIAGDEFGSQYSFKQVEEFDVFDETGLAKKHKLEVYGRTVMVSANASGDTDFLSSTILETSKMDDVYTQYTEEAAEQAALSHYGDYSRLEVSSADTRMIVYSLNEYEEEPVLAFLVKVSGTMTGESGDVYINEDVIVSGIDLSVIDTTSNISTWVQNQSGNDEMGNNLTFPVTGKWDVKYNPRTGGVDLNLEMIMRDSGTPEVVVYSGTPDKSNIVKKTGSSWNDGHQVSGYTNMRTVIKWWKDYFGRNSLNNKGMTVKLVTHEREENWRDNSFWNSGTEAIYVCDSSQNNEYEYSGAMGLDTLTHESSHAVLYYITGGIPYKNATGAIDEAYADIFGALRDEDWKHGWRTDGNTTNPERGITYFRDKTRCRRDLRADTSVKILSGYSLADVPALYAYYKDNYVSGSDNKGVHTYSRLIAHAAYLMHKDSAGSNGLTWYESRRIWYKSLFMGLDANSDFHTVRRNVLRAAQQYGLGNQKLNTIKKAFDAVGIKEAKGTLKLDISDKATRRPVSGARVTLTDSVNIKQDDQLTDWNGDAVVSADAGTYTVNVSASGYLPLTFKQYLPGDRTLSLNLELVKSGTGSLDITVRYPGGNTINGAYAVIYEGWNNESSRNKVRDALTVQGKYTFTNLSSGYYTLVVSKIEDDYPAQRVNIAVAPNTTNYKYVTLFSENDAYKYWAAIDYLDSGHSYLDVHMKGKGSIYGGSEFHVWDDNKKAYTTNGRLAAEVITSSALHIKGINFVNYYGSPLVFFLHWDSTSDPDWRGSGVSAWLYYKNKFLRKYTPPKDSSKIGLYWKVFTLSGTGVRKDTNEIVSVEPEAE